MALTRLTNLIATRTGRMLYVNPDDFNATDAISNNGNSPTRPFKTIQRALLEVARFSYVLGQNNDKYDQFTINLAPGDYIVDNRPGKLTSAEVPELSDQSNFDILDPNNDLVKFNSVSGGLVIPRGTSIVGMDLRKTRVRPRYVPEPTDSAVARTSIFKVTGACYFWQFSLFDALPTGDASGLGGVYNFANSTNIVDANYSHHKVTCFVYADQADLDLFYAKASRAFASIPETIGELESRVQENRIVGPLQQAGQKPISAISITGTIATVTSSGPHEVFEGQQITLESISGAYTSLNGTYYVQKVLSPNQFTTIVVGQPAGSVPSSALTNAIVKAEIDTVDSSSPYIFNCSLRSTYGLCGLWADGSLVTGFKSMVVAQFTGVSLQKDDRAFVKFTETTTPNPSFVLEGGSSDAIALHQDSAGYVYYRGDATTGWRHYHIRVSNNAFIQSVSVFAVGYAEQHLIESGGDYSITNSNSNFGTQALIADGFRPDAFTLDKKGYISHIVPPQSLDTIETEVPYYPIDVQKSKIGLSPNSVGTELHLFEQTDPDETPVFNINQYKVGGRVSDKIFVNLTNPLNNRIQEYQAFISPSGIEEHIITSVNRVTDTFVTQNTNNFETATPVRIYSSTGYLPLGMESNKLYYIIKITNNSFKIAPSEEDARAGAGGQQNSIVNIRSDVPTGAVLTIRAFVSDTRPELPRFDVQVNANQDSFSTGTFPHGFATGDRVFFKRRIISGVITTGELPKIQSGGTQQDLSLTTEYFVSVIDAYNFKISDSESNANNNIPIPIDTNGGANVIRVYRNIQKSPLRYSPQKSNWYVSVRADVTNTIHPILTSNAAGSIYANTSLANTENASFKRIEDARANPDRTYRLRYVLPKVQLNCRPPQVGYVIRRKTDDNNVILPYNTATASGLTSDFERIYFIYRINTILRHIPGEQDGIYYLTVLLADVAPKGQQFSSQTDTFGFLKYSQDVANIYPDLDKDNPTGDPSAAVTVADNLVHGLVYQDNNRNSITKEAVTKFVTETGYAPVLASIGGKATSGQENRLIPFSGNNPLIEVELRRTSQIRAGNQTFEYTGFGSGNYSTAFPSKQIRVLNDKEVLYSQAQRRRAGIVFYSGLNAYGDLYVGNQKINAVTGEVEILDEPILRVGGDEAVENKEFVPYVSGTKDVNEIHTISTTGGPNLRANGFNNESNFFEGLFCHPRDADSPRQQGRALITSDIVLRAKSINPENPALQDDTQQFGKLFNTNLRPTPGIEGTFFGDMYYKWKLRENSRHMGYMYVGPDGFGNLLNNGWRQVGLVGVGHLTSIEDSYSSTVGDSADIEPYDVTGRFGINKVAPSGSLHVGTGDAIIDNNLTVGLDLAVNGGDITSTATNFNLLNQPTGNITAFSGATGTLGLANAASTVNAFNSAIVADILTSATDIDLGGSTGTLKIHNASVIMDGDLAVNGGDITSTATNFNLLNEPTGTVNAFTSAKTVNAFTSATTLNFAATSGTTTIKNDLQIDGNLRVRGSTTTVNSTVTTVKDPIITLGGNNDDTIFSTIPAITILQLIVRWNGTTVYNGPASGITNGYIETGGFRYYPAAFKGSGYGWNIDGTTCGTAVSPNGDFAGAFDVYRLASGTSGGAAEKQNATIVTQNPSCAGGPSYGWYIRTNNKIELTNDGKDRGVEMRYLDSDDDSEKLLFMGWDNSEKRYTLLQDATNSSEVFTGVNAQLNLGRIRFDPPAGHTPPAGSPTISYVPNPFANFSSGQYTTASNTDVDTNFRRLLEKYSLPVGMIMMWSGDVGSIPEGWCLCDGVQRRDRDGVLRTPPNLRDRFIAGAGTSYTVNQTGGSAGGTFTTTTNSVTPTASTSVNTSVSGGISGTRLTTNQIPPHQHGMSHQHKYGFATATGVAVQSGTGATTAVITTVDAATSGYYATTTQSPIGSSRLHPGDPEALATGTGIDRWPGIKNTLGEFESDDSPAAEHTHASNISASSTASTTLNNTDHTHNVTVPTIPPFYALAYIYKL